MFKAWGCRPTPRRADARSTAFSPKSPRGLRPLSRLPGPGRGGGNGLFGPPSYPDRSADVVRLHRIFEYPTCLHTRISQFLLAFLLFATTSPRIGRHLPARKDVLIDGEAWRKPSTPSTCWERTAAIYASAGIRIVMWGCQCFSPPTTRHCGGALVIHHRKPVSIPRVLKSRVLASIWANRRPNQVTDSPRRPCRRTRAP